MGIARDGDAAAVEIARLIELTEFFQRLAAVKVGGGIIRIGFRDLLKGGDGAIVIAGLDVLHGKSVAREGAPGILIEELLEDFDAGRFQAVRITFKAQPHGLSIFQTAADDGVELRPSATGAIFEGECERRGTGAARFCNFGYARGSCAEFPAETAVDVVRFSVSGNADGIVKVVWIFEKDHAPVEHGLLEYSKSTGAFVAEPAGVLGAQARIFVENYLRR